MDALLSHFLAQLPAETQVRAQAQATELGAILCEQLAGARAAYPGVALDEPGFAAALAERLATAHEIVADLRKLRAQDVLLVAACLAGDRVALQAVDSLLSAEVDASATSVRAPAGLADEVKQRLREQLLVGGGERGAAIRDFAGRGELRGFLRVSAVRELLRQMQRQKREIGMDEDELQVHVAAVDPELERLKASYRVEFADCFGAAVAGLPPRERTLLRLHAIDQLSIDQIGTLYGTHRATAARWLARARAQVAQRTEEKLAERLALSTTEVASVIRLVRSQLDVSLARLLADPPEKG
jgi:RNA polymerase sigma-70 factor (ECF subfamily)